MSNFENLTIAELAECLALPHCPRGVYDTLDNYDLELVRQAYNELTPGSGREVLFLYMIGRSDYNSGSHAHTEGVDGDGRVSLIEPYN